MNAYRFTFQPAAAAGPTIHIGRIAPATPTELRQALGASAGLVIAEGQERETITGRVIARSPQDAANAAGAVYNATAAVIHTTGPDGRPMSLAGRYNGAPAPVACMN